MAGVGTGSGAKRTVLSAAQKKLTEERRKARERYLAGKRTRNQETRRKILVGAVVLAKIEQGQFEHVTLMGWLDGALKREDDRALFGLALIHAK